MTSVIVPSVDLAPSLPSRVVTVELIDVTEGQAVSGAEIDFFLPGDLHVPADDVIVQAGKVTLTLDSEGKGRVRLPAYTDQVAPSDWVIGVKKRWAPHPYYIRVPAGSPTVSLADIPAVQTLPQGVVDWMITGASASVTEGAQWDVALSLAAGILKLDLTVPPGGEAFYRSVGLGADADIDTLTSGLNVVTSGSRAEALGLPVAASGSLLTTEVWGSPAARTQFYIATASGGGPARVFIRQQQGGLYGRWDQIRTDSDPRSPQFGGGENLFEFVDAANRQTWLGARASDGGPTEFGEQHLRDRLGITRTPGEYVGFGDAAGIYTELRAETDTGRVPADVLRDWGARAGWGTGVGLAPGDRYVNRDGDLAPVFPIVNHMIGWGSSSLQLTGPHLVDVFPEVTYVDEAKGGEGVSQAAARMGAVPALLTVTGGQIPADGPVGATASNMLGNQYLKPFHGTLAGVPGVLTSTSNTDLVFTRDEPGSTVMVSPDTPFIPTVPGEYRQYVGVLWAGKSNLQVVGRDQLVLDVTRTMFEYFTPMVKRVVVMTHFIDSDKTPADTQFVQVNSVNEILKSEYGVLCFDANAYILSPQIWDDTGITPTSGDLTQQGNGVKPDSLSVDNGHLNPVASAAVAARLREHMHTLGWY